MRARHPSTVRQNRAQGIVSGVTIVTSPSGVTVYNSTVQNDQGYATWNTSDGVLMQAGSVLTGGTSKYFTAAALGLTTVTHLIPVNRTAISGSSRLVFDVVRDEAAGTGATVYMFVAQSGATQTTGVSLGYLAVGT